MRMSTSSKAPLSALALAVFSGSILIAGMGQQPPPPAAGAPAQAPAPRGPAPTLARPIGPSKAPDEAGFIRRWLVLEPIRVPGQLTEPAARTAVQKEYFANQLTVLPRDGDVVTVGEERLTWRAYDTTAYNLNLFHFAYALNKPTSNVLFWAVTVVNAPREMSGVRLAIGSNAASIWWLNGQEVIGLYNDRQAVIDDGVSRRVTLKAGPNVIRTAIINAGGATDFCARFLDEAGNPIKGFTVSLADDGKSR